MGKLAQLAAPLVTKFQLTKDEAETFVNLMFEVLNEGLHHDKLVKVKGLGTFKVTAVASRESIDVNTGQRITIVGRDKITFVPEAALRDRVNSPFAQFETVAINEGVDFTQIDNKYHIDTQYEEDNQLKEKSEEASYPVVENNHDTSNDAPQNVITATGKDNQPVAKQNQPPEEGSSPRKAENTEYAEKETLTPMPISVPVSTKVKQENSSPQPSKSSPAPNIPSKQTKKNILQTEDNNTESTSDVERTPGTATQSEADDDKANSTTYTAAQPTVVNTTVSETESIQEMQRMDIEDLAEQLQKTGRWVKVLSAALLFLLVVTGISAFFLGQQFTLKNNRIAHLEAENQELIIRPTTMKDKPTSTTLSQKTEERTSVKSISDKADTKETVETSELKYQENAVKSEKANKITVEKIQKNQPDAVLQEQYNKNARVRTGAYRIDGVAQTVIVRTGQTLESISKAFLGPGMECYVEALNGRTEVKEGDMLKIPKLSLKKKRKE